MKRRSDSTFALFDIVYADGSQSSKIGRRLRSNPRLERVP